MMLIISLLYLIDLSYVINASNNIKVSNDRNVEVELSHNDEEKERYLFYEYNFWSMTRIYEERTKLDESIIEIINATYSFHILHYDPAGKILGRYQFLKCISGSCHYDMPDVYVNFIQGGNNLEGLYVTTILDEKNWKVNWNVLFAIIYATMTPAKIGGGDEQNVVKIELYFRQNTKSNADIIDIEAEEKMILKSLIIPDWSLVVETQAKMRMTNRTVIFGKPFCSTELLADECAQTVFKTKRMGKNWKEINQKLNIGVKRERSKLKSVLKESNSEFPDKKGDGLAAIVNSILFATDQDLLDAIREFRNTPIMSVFVDAIGLAGTMTAYTVGKNAFTTEAPEFLERFLQALSQTTKIDIAIINDLKIWMKNTNDKYYAKHIAFTIANLYRRYCQSTKSRKYACKNGKNDDVNEFTKSIIAQCKDSDCQINALQIFENLPLLNLLPYAIQFLCVTNNSENLVQQEALRFLQLFDGKYFHWKTINKLFRIFYNACPLRQTITDQTLAIEILLNIVPNTELIGTYFLRSEELFPVEQEKWAYFYSSIARKRQTSPNFNSYWAKMRSFRVFQPNYAHRSLKATSDVSAINIAELGNNNNITVWIKTVNDKGISSWNDFSILLTSAKRPSFPLLQIFTGMKGMKSYLLESESYNSNEESNSDNPLAIAQIGLLNNRNVPITIFHGYGELINVVWNANGQPMLLCDKNLIYRQYYGYIPLMSGLSITVDVIGTIAIDLYGSATINLWNKDAGMKVNSTISTKLEGSINLASSNNLIGRATTLLYASGTVNVRFDADFFTVPHLFCITVSHSPIVIKYMYTHSTKTGKEKHLWHNIKLSGSSLWLNKKLSDHCSLFEK
uniref:MTP large subunit lipid-binding domain-containing protein n=4 Tax=Wuchereria bancrofti TaxID=6293 RepID=A0AAF5PIP9_WUCBA